MLQLQKCFLNRTTRRNIKSSYFWLQTRHIQQCVWVFVYVCVVRLGPAVWGNRLFLHMFPINPFLASNTWQLWAPETSPSSPPPPPQHVVWNLSRTYEAISSFTLTPAPVSFGNNTLIFQKFAEVNWQNTEVWISDLCDCVLNIRDPMSPCFKSCMLTACLEMPGWVCPGESLHLHLSPSPPFLLNLSFTSYTSPLFPLLSFPLFILCLLSFPPGPYPHGSGCLQSIMGRRFLL